MSKVPGFYKRILELRGRYFAALPGKESLLKMIASIEVPEQVYNSNAIENSTLSLEETERILLEVNLDRYVTPRELFEAKNLARVVEYIDAKAKEVELSLELMLLLHKMLLSNIRDDVAGRFRGENEWVRVGLHLAPNPQEVKARIEKMLESYFSTPEENIVTRVSILHSTFEHIHPYVDGNGRIGRVLNNYLLIREGYVPINIKYSNRDNYYLALREFDLEGKISGMENIIGLALTNSYHKRLAYMEGKKIITLKEHSEKGTQSKGTQSYSNLLNKAKRQTIEAFMERGAWKIGI